MAAKTLDDLMEALLAIRLKHGNLPVYLADWSEEYEPPGLLTRVVVSDGKIIFDSDDEKHFSDA